MKSSVLKMKNLIDTYPCHLSSIITLHICGLDYLRYVIEETPRKMYKLNLIHFMAQLIFYSVSVGDVTEH